MQEVTLRNRRFTILKNSLFIFILFVIYKLVLDYSYKSFVFGMYEYFGFKYSFDLLKYIEVWIYSLLLFFVTPKREDKVSMVFLNLQFTVMIMPMLTIYSFMEFSKVFIMMIIVCHIFQVFLLNRKTEPIKLKITGISKVARLCIPILLLILLFISILKNGMPSLKALNLNNVYEIRNEVNLPFGFGYFLNWASKIIIPFCIVFYWQKKRKLLVVFYVSVQVLLFLIYAHKTYLFIIPVIFAVMYILKKKIMIKGLYGGLVLGIISSLVIFSINNEFITLPSIFIRRFLFVPAYLKNMYYNFYSIGPKNWFAYGTLGNLLNVEPNYPYTTSTMVATYIHGEFWTGANTGYMGDAYAQGGFLMMIIFSIILVLVIKLIEKCSNNLDNSFVIASSLYIFLTLNDGALLTTLLTGGLIIYIFILYAFNSDNIKYSRQLEKDKKIVIGGKNICQH